MLHSIHFPKFSPTAGQFDGFPQQPRKAHAMHQMFTHPEAHSLPPRGKKGGQQLLILPVWLKKHLPPSCCIPAFRRATAVLRAGRVAGAAGKQPCSPTLSRGVHPEPGWVLLSKPMFHNPLTTGWGTLTKWPLEGGHQDKRG